MDEPLRVLATPYPHLFRLNAKHISQGRAKLLGLDNCRYYQIQVLYPATIHHIT